MFSAQFRLGQGERFAHQVVQVERGSRGGAPFCEGADSLDDCASSNRVPVDPARGFACFGEVRRLSGEPAQDGVGVGHDRGERLVDLVRDGRRQLAHHRQARHPGQLGLGFAQFVVPFLSLRDILVDDDGARDLSPALRMGAAEFRMVFC